MITGGEVLYYPEPGRGVDLLSLDEPQLRELRWSHIAVVLQSAMNALNPVLSIGIQLTDVLQAHQPGQSAAARRQRAAELLDMVGITADRLRSYPHELSGGMRQRVMIAMALALEPQIVILDEPTTALDVVTQREILEELTALRERLGFAVLFITHDLSLLVEIADSIAVMYAGRLVERAAAADLFRAPRHPYTVGLLNSFPSLHGPHQHMTGIPGSPPDLRMLPVGCVFHPRCRYAMDICREQSPPLDQPAIGAARQHPAGRVLAAGRRARGPRRAGAARAGPPGPARPHFAERQCPRLRHPRLHRRRWPSGLARAREPGMTETAAAPRAPETGVPLLEARGLTKHFTLHHAPRRGRARAGPAHRPAPGGARGGGRLAHAAPGRDHRGGRREWLRQVHAGPAAGPADHPDVRGTAAGRPAGARVAAGSRREYARNVQLVLQDPFSSLNPVHDVRYHLARPLQIHGLGEPGGTLDAAVVRPAGAGGADARPPSSSASTPMSCPAASGSGWRSPARWPSGHGCCWPTSRSPCSTCRSGSAS